MSNFLAISTVTATLRRMLQATVPIDVPAADATAVRPDASATALPTTGVNIFLYQVTPNAAWRNADLPTRSPAGGVVQRPRIALDLHYLLSFYGDESLLEPQSVLGSVVRTLHARPYLTRELIESTVTNPAFAFLLNSNLADEVELVKFTPLSLSLEELSKLWSILFQTPYTLSIAYLGTVVLIEAEETPQRPLPVLERVIVVSPFQHPFIERIVALTGERDPVEMGGTIVIHGRQLDGTIDRVRVGVAGLPPVSGSVTPSHLQVALTDPALRAGVLGVQIRYTNGSESNVEALVLHPVVTVDQPNVTSTAVPITLDPAVSREQRVLLHLNEFNPPAGRTPFAFSFEAPSNNGITDPLLTETTDITFAIANVDPAEYLVRIQVNGAENVLDVDTDPLSPTFQQYNNPRVTIP